MSLIDATQLSLEAAMRGSMLRQTVLTNDVANADTPGFQPEDVNFQSQLEQALASGTSPDQVSFQPTVSNQSAGADGNGTSAEQEQANIAENALTYQTLEQVAGAREETLLTAMGLH
jgi:flagellar basal-body rod protein FlgB